MIESVSFAALLLKDLKKGISLEQSYQNASTNIKKNNYRLHPFGNYDPLTQFMPFADKLNELYWNKNGFIDNENNDPQLEIFPEKPNNIYRILLLGGSSAASLTGAYSKNKISGQETIAGKLEKKLNNHFKTNKNLVFQVLNFAQLGGWSGNSLSRFTHYLSHVEPDLIIHYSGYNDAVIEYGSPYINWSSPADLNYFNATFPKNYLNKRIKKSIFFPFSIPLLNSIFFPTLSKKQIDEIIQNNEQINPLPRLITDYVKNNKDRKPSLYIHNLNLLAGSIEKMNISYVHFLQAYNYDLNKKYYVHATNTLANLQSYKKEIKKIDSKFSYNKKIRFISKLNFFKDNENYFTPDGYHLNEAGNNAIADEFFKTIISLEKFQTQTF